MFIKTLIKSLILDSCIDIFFKRLEYNFINRKSRRYLSLYTLPLVRQVFPELFANKIVSVIPMGQPCGIEFATRYIGEDRQNRGRSTPNWNDCFGGEQIKSQGDRELISQILENASRVSEGQRKNDSYVIGNL